jgi:hypothetical protein
MERVYPLICCTKLPIDLWSFMLNLLKNWNNEGSRGNVVIWGSMLQARGSRVPFPMRSLDFSIYLIFAGALWPWGRNSL